MALRFHPAARRELREALDWYQERSALAATAFAYEVAAAIEQIAEAPARRPLREHGTRRLILPRFPLSIVYRAGPSEVVIIAVAHHKRRPAYWRDR